MTLARDVLGPQLNMQNGSLPVLRKDPSWVLNDIRFWQGQLAAGTRILVEGKSPVAICAEAEKKLEELRKQTT